MKYRFFGYTVFFASILSATGASQFNVDISTLDARAPYGTSQNVGFDFQTHAHAAGPYFLSFAAPPGTYELKLVLGGPTKTVTTIRAESRQLLIEAEEVPAHARKEITVHVNVRNGKLAAPPKNSPGGDAVRLNPREDTFLRWDDRLTLEVGGRAPGLLQVSIRPAEVPVVFLLGDSTVTDQNAEPGASWGQMLPRFLKGVAVANHAESGETLKSFVSELRLAKVLEEVKPGDFALLQFGHNDQKVQWPQTYVEAGTTYDAWLRVFISELRLRGVTPVLCTSTERRNFDEAGRIKPSHGRYPEAVRKVAREESVLLIDLNEQTRLFYQTLGPQEAVRAFLRAEDATHHNNYGAYQIANMVATALRASQLPLAKYVVDLPPFDAEKPLAPDQFSLPPSLQRSEALPRGN